MTDAAALWACLLALSAAGVALLAILVRRLALRWRVVDVPNRRSSHHGVTPRGGGLAIVLVFAAGCGYLYQLGQLSAELFFALCGGLSVAAVGLLDDIRRLSVAVRLGAHLAAALWLLYWLGGLPPLHFGPILWQEPVSLQLLALLSTVWLINLYNFMDGIDGLACAEGLFAATAGVWVCVGTGGAPVLALLAAGCGGFLLLNWAPAKLFLGDVGSCFLGFVFATVVWSETAARGPWPWLILLGVFLCDATVTLLRRLCDPKARWYQAHRSHAYQHLARRLGHAETTLLLSAVNVCWLLPWALAAARRPADGAAFGLAALAPLALAAVCLGAGRGERS